MIIKINSKEDYEKFIKSAILSDEFLAECKEASKLFKNYTFTSGYSQKRTPGEFQPNDIVIVNGGESIPKEFYGRIGIIDKKFSDDKYMVIFNLAVSGLGSLSHTVFTKDLTKIGHVDYMGG